MLRTSQNVQAGHAVRRHIHPARRALVPLRENGKGVTMIDFKSLALATIEHAVIPGVSIHLMNIGPKLATEMLECNTNGQRPLSDANVSRYGEDILEGAWRFAGDPIRFNAAGELIDGQHRLTAVAEAKEEETFVVITGLDHGIMAAIDSGRRRTFANLLKIEHPDISYSRTISGIVTRALYWERGNYSDRIARTATASNHNIVPSSAALMATFHTVQRNLGVTFEHAAKVGHQCNANYPGITPTSYGFLWIQLSEINKDLREAFFHELLVEPRSASFTYPIEALKKRLMKLADSAHESWPSHIQTHFLNTVVNAWVRDQEITALRTPPVQNHMTLAQLDIPAELIANVVDASGMQRPLEV